MKSKIYTIVALLATTFAGISPANAQYAGTVTDTVLMGQSYANEVYYSMSAGKKGSAARATWDIAFRASRMSASILTNDGSGVELYTYPKADIDGWATVDTSGISGWKKMYNSVSDWETGAFCVNQKVHPDYGWGKYNSFSHNVVGDSLFVIKLRDGSFRKLWIMEKYSSDNVFEFRFAKLDNSDDHTIQFDCNPYATKNFIGYSLITNEAVDFEPVVSSQWDILFTKYMGINNGQPYPVVGVLSNYRIKVKKFENTAPDFISTEKATDSTRSPIGYDWKTFNMASFTYDVANTTAYFVQDRRGEIYKLVFKQFAGTSTGRIVFDTELISLTAVKEVEKSGFNAAVYPNPVSEVMNLVVNPGKSRLVLVSVLDLSGRTLLSKHFELQADELSTVKIPVAGFTSGVYMVKVQAGNEIVSNKIIVNN